MHLRGLRVGLGVTALAALSIAWAEESPPPQATPDPAEAPPPATTATIPVKDAAADKPADDAVHLAEIEVTARKRSETLQDVPISLSALSQKTLEDMGAKDMDDYIHFLPGVSLVSLAPGNEQVTVRGVTASAFSSPNLQATVAQYVDEMIISDPKGAQLDLRMFDVKRVELLRGPQGTLYGAGSMGGALRIITNQPDPRAFSSALESTLSSTQNGGLNKAVDAMVNVPIADSLAGRITAYYRNDDGFIDNVTLGQKNVNTNKTTGGRFALRWVPLDRLVVSANLLKQKMDLGMAAWFYSRDVGDLVSLIHKPETQNDDITLGNLTLDYNFGWAGLTSATSYLKGHRFELLSFEEVIDNNVGFTLQSRFPNSSQVVIPYNNDRIVTEEVRLASQTAAWDLDWMVGLYFQRATNDVFADTVCPECYSDPRTAGVFAGLDSRPALKPSILREVANKGLKQNALFGETTYHVTDDWAATVGVRAFRADFSQSLYQDGALYTLSNPSATGPGLSDTTTSQRVVTPKVQIQYNPVDDVMLYAIASEGYRVGGANPVDPSASASTPKTFKSDSLWNYEITAKTEWLDRTLTVNASIYDLKWKDIQTPSISPGGFALVVNGGRATVVGTELEVVSKPLKGLELSSSASWTRPRFDEDVPALAVKAGDPLPAVPKWSGAASAQYGFPLFSDFKGVGRMDYVYVGKSYEATLAGSGGKDLSIGNYSLVNARFGLVNGPWEITAFANNLLDKRTILSSSPILTYRTDTTPPRTTGLTLKRSF